MIQLSNNGPAVIKGTKFNTGDGVEYTISRITIRHVEITWDNGKDGAVYSTHLVKEYFEKGSWKVIPEVN